jgi:glycosyltransferase involved in cell wall biosynthesis
MRILFTCPTFAPFKGGAESFVDDLGRALVAEQHDVAVATARFSESLPRREERDGLQVYRLDYPPQHLGPRQIVPIVVRGLGLFLGLLGIIRRRRPDVVCLGLVGIEAFVVLLLWRLFSFRLVVYLHGGELRSYVKVSRFMRWTLGACLRACDAAIAVSPALADEAIALEPRVRRKISVVPNGVDASIFERRSLRPCARPYALYAGRLVAGKGLDTLVEAFEHVAACTPDLDLVIAGAGDEETRLRATAGSRAIRDRVRFLGEQERAEVAALLQGCECLVLPSDAEGCPMIALEAMVAGAVVVGSRAPGVMELVAHEQTGLLVAPGDAHELAEAICRLHCQPELRRELAAHARAAGSAYDVRALAARHLRIYAGAERRLTICAISLFYYWDPSCAGLSTYYFNLARSLAAMHHEVYVITAADNVGGPSVGHVVPVRTRRVDLTEADEGASLVSGVRRVVGRVRFAWQAYRTVRRIDRAVGVDVVMAPELFGQGLFAALWMRRKLITHVHTPTHISDRYNERPHPLVTRLLALPERLQTTRSRAVFVASRGLAAVLQAEWGIPAPRLHLVPNAVELSWVRQLAAGQPRAVEGEYLLYFGRLEKRKGVDVIGETLSTVFARRSDISMVFIGQDCGLRDRIAREHAGNPRIHFFDAMEKGPLFGAIRHAKLVVLPSRFENMSYAGLEAMALARPVIGTYGTAFADLIDDGADGFLVPAGDTHALAEKILVCLDRPDLDEIGRRAYERVRMQDAPAVAEQHIQICREVASGR